MTESASAYTPGRGGANDSQCFYIHPGEDGHMTQECCLFTNGNKANVSASAYTGERGGANDSECVCIHRGGGEQMTFSASASSK